LFFVFGLWFLVLVCGKQKNFDNNNNSKPQTRKTTNKEDNEQNKEEI